MGFFIKICVYFIGSTVMTYFLLGVLSFEDFSFL